MNTPLYKQLETRPYPSHQCLDRASALWLIEQGKPQRVVIHSLLPKYSAFPLDELNLRIEWFADTRLANGIHGVRHLVRVALYTWIITQYLKRSGTEEKKLTLDFLQAAMVHDIRRLNDNADVEHGQRTADWIKVALPGISEPSAAAVRFHAEDVPDGLDGYSLERLRVLKTADALDRFRLPKMKWWPDKERMPIDAGDDLVEFCKYVTLQTELETCGIEDIDVLTKRLKVWLKQEALI